MSGRAEILQGKKRKGERERERGKRERERETLRKAVLKRSGCRTMGE